LYLSGQPLERTANAPKTKDESKEQDAKRPRTELVTAKGKEKKSGEKDKKEPEPPVKVESDHRAHDNKKEHDAKKEPPKDKKDKPVEGLKRRERSEAVGLPSLIAVSVSSSLCLSFPMCTNLRTLQHRLILIASARSSAVAPRSHRTSGRLLRGGFRTRAARCVRILCAM
jgi:hypothetical protein